MPLRHTKQNTAQKTVVLRFVELASKIPEVQLILLEADPPERACVWTILDAPQFVNDVRYEVYTAERMALMEAKETPLDFRLTNIREANNDLEYYVRSDDQVLFRREAQK